MKTPCPIRRRGLVLMLTCLGAAMTGAVAPANEASEPGAPLVRHLGAGENSPPATVADVAWLEGRRIGPGFGGKLEEIWSSPHGGALPGWVRLSHGDDVTLYEVCVILEVEGTLELRLKHVGPGLGLWDDGDDSLTFRLVAVEENAVYFEGLTYRREPDGAVTAHLEVTSRRDGTKRVQTTRLEPVSLHLGGATPHR